MKRLDDGEGRYLWCETCGDEESHMWAWWVDGRSKKAETWQASGQAREFPICEYCAHCGPNTEGINVVSNSSGNMLLAAWTSDFDRMEMVYNDAAETFFHAKDVVRAFPAAKALDVMRPPLASDDYAKAVWAMSWDHQQWHDDLRLERAREDAERCETPETQGWFK